MCPDVVNTKLLTQRQREWKPDPQTINKCIDYIKHKGLFYLTFRRIIWRE